MIILEEILHRIRESHSVAIVPHVSADGDSIGSSTGLGLLIEKMGKKALIYLEEEVSYTLAFVPGKHLVRIYDGSFEEHDLVIALDCGDLERLGKRVDIFKKGPVTVNIDHHPTNTMFADLNYVHTQSAAVSEIIYRMAEMLGMQLDEAISTCLYTALTTDTGGFRYSNTTCVTHQIAGDLIDHGADNAYVSQQVFENMTLEKVRLMGRAIDSLEILEDGRIALMVITDSMLKECGALEQDCEGMVNMGRNIRGVEVAVVLREKEQELVKVNLRSKEYVDVSGIAAKFNGGGHKRAAGCTVTGSVDRIREELLNEIREALGERNERNS